MGTCKRSVVVKTEEAPPTAAAALTRPQLKRAKAKAKVCHRHRLGGACHSQWVCRQAEVATVEALVDKIVGHRVDESSSPTLGLG